MTPIVITNSESKTRVDKNVLSKLVYFRQFKDDAVLMKNVLFFLAYKRQTSLLNEITFDIDEISEVLGIARPNLAQRHPNPTHLQHLTSIKRLSEFEPKNVVSPGFEDYRIFDSQLENALYRLYSENLVYQAPAKYYSRYNEKGELIEEVKEIGVERIIFLERFKVRYIKSKSGQVKIAYDIILNNNFVQNLNFFYTPFNIKQFFDLRQSKIDDLYAFLTNLQPALAYRQTNTTNEITFQYLCDLSNCGCTNAKENKKILNSKFAQLVEATDLNVTLTWEKDPKSENARYKYQPVITFPNIEVQAAALPPEARRKEVYYENFVIELSKHAPDFSKTAVERFNNADMDLLQQCRREAHINTYKELPRNPSFQPSALYHKGARIVIDNEITLKRAIMLTL